MCFINIYRLRTAITVIILWFAIFFYFLIIIRQMIEVESLENVSEELN